MYDIAPGALECRAFSNEWNVEPPVSKWLQPGLSTNIDVFTLAPFNSSMFFRWTGYIVSFESAYVTFSVVSSTKFRFWVGQKLLMKREHNPDHVVQSFASMTPMTQHKHENLTIEFQMNGNADKNDFKVQWESPFWSKQDIPTANLWYVVRERDLSPVSIKVLSASVSPVSTFSCWTLMTAGIPSVLVVHSRDAYQNIAGDIADASKIFIGWSSSQVFLRTAVRNVDSSFTGTQIITVSGVYQMAVLLPRSPGNLIATVYSDSLFNRPVRHELRSVDFSCADMASYPVVGKDTFSLRWSGLFKPTKTALYTFQGYMHTSVTFFEESIANQDDSDEVFAMYLDGVLIAGNKGMNSSAVVRLPLSGTISLFQDAFYFIEVEYSSIRSGSFFTSKRLTLQMFQDGLPRSIPSESLFISEHLTGSPIQVTVHPSSQLCASISTQAISSGTIMTAGIHATLSLHAKDVFGNSLSEQHLTNQNVSAIFGGQIAERPRFLYGSFSEHTSMNFVLMKKGSCSLQWFARGVSIQEAFDIAVIPNAPDFSSISFTRNFHQFSTAGMFFQQTIYICDNFGNIRSFLEKNHDFSRDIQLHSNHSKSVFHYNVTLCRRNNDCAMYGSSGSSIQAGELALVSALVTLSGGIQIKCGFNFSDLHMEFWSQPRDMTILPAAVCAAKSLVIGSGLTIVTIGATTCVTILSRDAYSNFQDAFWVINVTTLTSSRTLIPQARRPSDSHVACYPPDFSSAHVGVLSVFVSSSAHEAPELVGTPSSLLYVSNTVCAAKCVIAGIGLSAATAGEFATFFIQSRDEIGNNVNFSPNFMVSLLQWNNKTKARPSFCQISPDTVIISSLQRMSNTSAAVSYNRNLSGPVTFQVALLQPGGLFMSIFDGIVSNEINELSIIEETSNLVFFSFRHEFWQWSHRS